MFRRFSMNYYVISRGKTLSFNQVQFKLLCLINELGFVSFEQLNLLWSIVNQTYISFSHSTLRRWLNDYKIIRIYKPTGSSAKQSYRPFYYVSKTGVRLLNNYQFHVTQVSNIGFNSHNEQANEVVIQALASYYLKPVEIESARYVTKKQDVDLTLAAKLLFLWAAGCHNCDHNMDTSALPDFMTPDTPLSHVKPIANAIERPWVPLILYSSNVNVAKNKAHDANAVTTNIQTLLARHVLYAKPNEQGSKQLVNLIFDCLDGLQGDLNVRTNWASTLKDKVQHRDLNVPTNIHASLKGKQNKKQSSQNKTVTTNLSLLNNPFSNSSSTKPNLTNLIHSTTIPLEQLNLHSFAQQFGITDNSSATFIADKMISFNRNGRKQEIFIELDNRTESNDTQMQKILNYIWYAMEHPKEDILLEVVITDGALVTRKVTSYTKPAMKMNFLLSKLIKTYASTKQQNSFYFYQLYQQVPNLTICFSGVGEAQVDLADFLRGKTYVIDRLNSAKKIAKLLTKHSGWDVSFEPSPGYRSLLKDSASDHRQHLLYRLAHDLPLKSTDHLNVVNPQAKGIWRYLKTPQEQVPTIGTFHYRYKKENKVYDQPVVAGYEHSLDTFIVLYSNISSKFGKSFFIYPTRQRPVSIWLVGSFSKFRKWNKHLSPQEPIYYQPVVGLDQNQAAIREAEYLLKRYPLYFFNYFDFHAIAKADTQADSFYQEKYLHPSKGMITSLAPLFSALGITEPATELKPYFPLHSYQELHALAESIMTNNHLSRNKQAQAFVNSISIQDIPLDVFNAVGQRMLPRSYSLPAFCNLPYWTNPLISKANQIPLKTDPLSQLFLPNKINEKDRMHPLIKKH